MLWEHTPDSCLSLPIISRLIRNVSALIAVTAFTNTIFGVIVLTEKCPAFFLTQREGTVEIFHAILLFK